MGRRQLAERAALDSADEVEIEMCRGEHNRLGFAYQVVFAKVHSRLPAQHPFEVEDELVAFAALQASLDSGAMDLYREQRRTIQRHQDRIREYRGLARLGVNEQAELEAFVFEMASRIDDRASLLLQAREQLREQGVLLPAESTLGRTVTEQRQRARQHIFDRIAGSIAPALRDALDELLNAGDNGISALQRIKDSAARPSPDGIVALLDKLSLIEATSVLEVDLSWLSANYQRALFHRARKLSSDRLRRMAPAHRQATVVCFLWQSYRDTIDQVVDMFDKLMTRMQRQAQEELDERMRQRRSLVRRSLQALSYIGAAILDESISGDDLRPVIYALVPREDLETYTSESYTLVSGKNQDPFHGLLRRYGQLRRFSPALLSALRLREAADSRGDCVRALEVLEELNATGCAFQRVRSPNPAQADRRVQRKAITGPERSDAARGSFRRLGLLGQI